MNRISKLIGAFLGGVTPASVVGYLAAFGVHLPEAQVGVILSVATLIASALGVYVAPKNAEKAPAPEAPEAPAEAPVEPASAPVGIQPPYPSAR